MGKHKDVPEDLGIKIGTKEEAAWKLIKDGAEKELEQQKRAIIIGEEIIKLADRMMEAEKKKSS